MAVPKKKKSKSRTRMGRAHFHIDLPTLVSCGQCQAKTRPHQVCLKCGYYRGRQVLDDGKYIRQDWLNA